MRRWARRAVSKRDDHMRTLRAYVIGVVIILAVFNVMVWQTHMPWLHSLNLFSAGFVLGVVGTSIAANLYGYRREPKIGAPRA